MYFFNQKNFYFFDWFWSRFGNLLGLVFKPNFIKNRVRNEKGDFLKMSTACTRELHFGGSGASKASQKTPQEPLKKESILGVENALKMGAKMEPKST